MIIDLNELNYKKEININYEVFKDDDLDKRILDLKDAKVEGIIYKDDNNDIHLDLIFKGTMILEDSITLDEVPYDFEIKIEENTTSLEENYHDCYENVKNILDLKQFLWQNIVLEVPISYTLNNDANLKGNGWELKNDDNKILDEIDPRLKKLENLLKGDD